MNVFLCKGENRGNQLAHVCTYTHGFLLNVNYTSGSQLFSIKAVIGRFIVSFVRASVTQTDPGGCRKNRCASKSAFFFELGGTRNQETMEAPRFARNALTGALRAIPGRAPRRDWPRAYKVDHKIAFASWQGKTNRLDVNGTRKS